MDTTFALGRRAARSAAVVLAVLVAICISTSSGRADDAKAPKSWRVEGRVLDDQGKPAAGVEVFTNELPYLPSARQSSTKSDSDGRFVLEIAHRVNGRLVRASQDDGRQQAAARLAYQVEKESKVPQLELKLRPAREIVSVVADTNEKPVAGAKVLVTAGYEQFTDGVTDDAGRVTLRVPADLALQYVIATKPAVGLDYWAYRGPDEPKSDPYKLAADHSGDLKFVLNGTRAVTVRVVDDKDQPLANVKVYPWLLQKPNKGSQNDDLNLGGLSDFTRKTDEQGLASFDFIPADETRSINFWAQLEGYCSPERHMFDPASAGSEVVAKLFQLVNIGGRVAFADGRPAPDTDVFVVGGGHSFDDFRQTIRSGKDGKFQLKGNPDQYYQFVAGNKEWASPGVNRIIRQGETVDDIALVLQPATRVFGQVTMGAKNVPVPKEYVSLYQHETKSYYELPEKEKLPNPKDSHSAVSALVVRSGETDSQGRFEFFVGPGKYYVIAATNMNRPKFEIGDEKTFEVNLHAERAESGPIKGRVVKRDDRESGVADAKVWGMPVDSFAGRFLQAVTDADGRFEATRALSSTVVYAGTTDHKFAGVARIGPEDTEITIPIGPTAAAHGRLIDEETGLPAADRQIDFGIELKFPDGTSTRFSGASTTTDAQGAFLASGLVPGEEYTFSAVMEKDADGHPRSWRHVGKVTPSGSDVVELGELKLPKTYRPPTTKEKVAKAFADSKALKKRVASRLRDTNHAYQRVLFVIGDPASPLIQRFYELEYDKELDGAAYNYQFVPVNTADAEQAKAVQSYLSEVGIPIPAKEEPVLAVLDEKGALAEKAPFSLLLTERTLDPAKVAAFLNAFAPQLPDAEVLLADALAQAKREGKRVFVQVSGPRCGWCFVLSRFLDTQHDLMDKEFVYVKLDDRLKNGDAVIKRVRPKADGGIPWTVFLDENGQPLITSDGPDGNIGYPGEPEGRVQFEKMLRASPKHLTDADIKTIIEALEKNKI